MHIVFSTQKYEIIILQINHWYFYSSGKVAYFTAIFPYVGKNRKNRLNKNNNFIFKITY